MKYKFIMLIFLVLSNSSIAYSAVGFCQAQAAPGNILIMYKQAGCEGSYCNWSGNQGPSFPVAALVIYYKGGVSEIIFGGNDSCTAKDCNLVPEEFRAQYGCVTTPPESESCTAMKQLFDPPATDCDFQYRIRYTCYDPTGHVLEYQYEVKDSQGRVATGVEKVVPGDEGCATTYISPASEPWQSEMKAPTDKDPGSGGSGGGDDGGDTGGDNGGGSGDNGGTGDGGTGGGTGGGDDGGSGGGGTGGGDDGGGTGGGDNSGTGGGTGGGTGNTGKDYSGQLNTIIDRLQTIDDDVKDSGQKVSDSVQESGQKVSDTVKESGQGVVDAINTLGQKIEDAAKEKDSFYDKCVYVDGQGFYRIRPNCTGGSGSGSDPGEGGTGETGAGSGQEISSKISDVASSLDTVNEHLANISNKIGGTNGGGTGEGEGDNLGSYSGDGGWGKVNGLDGMGKGEEDLKGSLDGILDGLMRNETVQIIRGHKYITIISPKCFFEFRLWNHTYQISFCEYEEQLRLFGNILFGLVTIMGFVYVLKS